MRIISGQWQTGIKYKKQKFLYVLAIKNKPVKSHKTGLTTTTDDGQNLIESQIQISQKNVMCEHNREPLIATTIVLRVNVCSAVRMDNHDIFWEYSKMR